MNGKGSRPRRVNNRKAWEATFKRIRRTEARKQRAAEKKIEEKK